MPKSKLPNLRILHSEPELTEEQEQEIKKQLRPLAATLHRLQVKSLEVENPALQPNNKPTLTMHPIKVAPGNVGPE